MPARADDNHQRATTGGPGVSGVRLRVVHPETGAELPAGEPGELLVRGYLVMEGYYRDPEQTSKVIDKDGWLEVEAFLCTHPVGQLADRPVEHSARS
jgi:long-subunit acyl-CoA synthetase (AMP-forming)